jgi:hypothetical protein
MPITTALRRLRQEDHGFEANSGYIAKLCLSQSIKPANKHTNKKVKECTQGMIMLSANCGLFIFILLAYGFVLLCF